MFLTTDSLMFLFSFFRSEFGLLLAYFYLCDRTNLFGESTKVLYSLGLCMGLYESSNK